MKHVANAALIVALFLLAGCVGYFHIGGSSTRPNKVEIRYGTTPSTPVKCQPYEMPTETEWPAYPQFAGTEPDDDIIDALGHEIVALHERHRAYVAENRRKYQEYVQRCMSQ